MVAATAAVADGYFLVGHSPSVEAAMVCKTVPYDWRVQRSRSSRPVSASANGFANETDRDGGRRRETPATLPEVFAWSARRTGMPDTGETCIAMLITQRSRV